MFATNQTHHQKPLFSTIFSLPEKQRQRNVSIAIGHSMAEFTEQFGPPRADGYVDNDTAVDLCLLLRSSAGGGGSLEMGSRPLRQASN